MEQHQDDDVAEQEEKDHWKDVMRTLLTYTDFVDDDLRRRQEHLNRLPDVWANRLPSETFSKLNGIGHAAQANQQFFHEIVDFYSEGQSPHPQDGKRIPYSQQHRNQAVLHSFYREWSAEGARERAQAFDPLIQELQRLLPVNEKNAYCQKVCVPGSGLGRLPLEIAAKGYKCQGNEFSAFMAMASSFVLNGIAEPNAFTIYPWIDRVCNVVKVADVMKPIRVPDVAACALLESCPYHHTTNDRNDLDYEDEEGGADVDGLARDGSSSTGQNNTEGTKQPCKKKRKVFMPRFSMCAGDFVELYRRNNSDNNSSSGSTSGDSSSGVKAVSTAVSSDSIPLEDVAEGEEHEDGELWDAVVTCFFVDTAPVVVEYIETIHSMLRPGGVWVNLGPLLYHWANDVEQNEDARYQQSIELSWEELRHVIGTYGFQFNKEEFVECKYANNEDSIMWTGYNAIFFSATKPLL